MESTISKPTEEQMHQRGVNAAVAFLQRKGCEVLEAGGDEFDLVYVDTEDGRLCFCNVHVIGENDEEPDSSGLQREYEKKALAWCIEAELLDDALFRFDDIVIRVTPDFKALLKHHMGMFA